MNSLEQKSIDETLNRLTILDSQQNPPVGRFNEKWGLIEIKPCEFQPLDKRIAYLMKKFWDVELANLVNGLSQIKGNPWADRGFVEYADKAMKTAYTISKLTLTEFPDFMKHAEEYKEDFDGNIPSKEEILTEYDTYQRLTLHTCFHFYQLLRGRISYDRENSKVMIPEVNTRASHFYTDNTIQNEWRELSNLYCREAKQFFEEVEVDAPAFLQEDSHSETFRFSSPNPLIWQINLVFRDKLLKKESASEKKDDKSQPTEKGSVEDYTPVPGIFSGSPGKFQINKDTYPAAGAQVIESALRRLEGMDVKTFIFSAGWNSKNGTHQPFFGEIPKLTTLYKASYKQFSELLDKMPLVYHQSQEDEDVTTLDRDEEKKAEQERIKAFLSTAYEQWKSEKVMAAADELMQLAYTISCLTLEDLNTFTEELKKLNHPRGVAEALTRQDSYPYRAYFFFTSFYHLVRGGVGSFNGNLICPSLAAGASYDIPQFHSALFFEEGTVQSRWRDLYNDFCYRVGKFVDLKALKEIDDRFTKWIQPDMTQDKFNIHPCIKPT